MPRQVQCLADCVRGLSAYGQGSGALVQCRGASVSTGRRFAGGQAAVNKALWICSLVGAAVGITIGLAVFDKPVLGFALGLGLGALVGASIKRKP